MNGPMNADQILAFADSMRAYARESGRDLNAANLFEHAMLARALLREPAAGDNPACWRTPTPPNLAPV